MEMSWVKSQQPMPSLDAASTIHDEDVALLEVPNQEEIKRVARLLQREQTRLDLTPAASQHREYLFTRLEALHDNPANEKAVLFHLLHRPLEKFLELEYMYMDVISSKLQRRGQKLLSLWKTSLKRREKGGATPARANYTSLESTPAGDLYVPRPISESPEPEMPSIMLMNLDIDRNRRNSTTFSDRLSPPEEHQIESKTDKRYKLGIHEEKSIECSLCSRKVSPNPQAIQHHVRSEHKPVLSKKTEVPKNKMEYCEQHNVWFVHKNRDRHYNSHKHVEKPLAGEAFVFDPTTLSRSPRKRPIGKKSKLYDRNVDHAKFPPPDIDVGGEVEDTMEVIVPQHDLKHTIRSLSSPILPNESETSSTTSATSDEANDTTPTKSYNLRVRKHHENSAIPTEAVPRSIALPSPGSPHRVAQKRSASPTITVARRSQGASNLGKRLKSRADKGSLKAALKPCKEYEDVRHFVTQRVPSPVDDTEILDEHFNSSVSVRESQIQSMVRGRVDSDGHDVAHDPDATERRAKIRYLEARCEMLTRRNIALEGERARFKALAQRAMYGEPDGTQNDRQQALDKLVREHLDWNESPKSR